MKKKSTPSESLTRYGVTATTDFGRTVFAHPLLTELFLFKECRNERFKDSYDGPGTYAHAVNAADMIWRQPGHEMFVWHPDLETALEEYCVVGERGETLITGPASGGKTFGAALYILLSFLSDPDNTGALICSTTLDGLKRRLWGDIRRLFLAIHEHPLFAGLNIVDSKTCIQSNKGDMKHGIFGIAVAEGNERKALGRIIGFHPKRLFVVVDELTDVGWAIVEACTNLFTGKQKAHFIGIGNATSFFDSHGKMCEPADGWNSINVDSPRWITKRSGICVHFDGFKSPNIKHGKVIYPFLLKPEDIEETRRNYGENSPQMWRMRRGFWCPDGTVSTVMSEPLINNFLCLNKAIWQGEYLEWAALDPAFEGGDRCVLRFGRVGKDNHGRDVLECSGIHIIKPDASRFEQRPLEYQIADQVKDQCGLRGIPVERFGMDITGAGASLAAIVSEEWGNGFHRTHFAERASDLACSPTDLRSCYDVYKNKVTELWYSIRQAIMGYQIKALDPETAVELCHRKYESGTKICVESKTEIKSNPGGKSPDLADALAVLLDTVKHKGAMGEPASRARRSSDHDWQQLVKEFAISEADEYTQDSVMAV